MVFRSDNWINTNDIKNTTNPFNQTWFHNVPLPVELTSFSASVNTNNVSINWKTATEVNNNGFEVQRKVGDQKSEVRGQWEKIGFVQGHGNSNSPKEYSFTDKNLTGGTNFHTG